MPELRPVRHGPVVVLPRTVLRGVDRVLTVDSAGHIRFRQVELFRLERDRILIASGIEEGDRIIVSPLENAVDGMAVRVSDPSEEEDRHEQE